MSKNTFIDTSSSYEKCSDGYFANIFSGCGLGSDKGPLSFKTGDLPVVSPVETKPQQPDAGTDTETVEKDLAFIALQTDLFTVSCNKCHNAETALKRNRFDLTKKAVVRENIDDILYRMTDAFQKGEGFMPPKKKADGTPEGPVAVALINDLKVWKEDPDYAYLKKNLFEASCTKCHNPERPKRFDLTSKAVIAEKYDVILQRMTTAFTEPGGKPMPPKGKGEAVASPIIAELMKWKETH